MQSGKLVLVGSKRLLVRGIKHFEVEFNSLYQIILGTNGSGKSTILSELSPLPAIPKMFAKGGRKEFHCRSDGVDYILINDFETAGGRHSFVRDGIDLNENGTSTIQRELVKKYFNNLTPELFNVLTFRKFHRFTEMDVNKRRYWMMLLSGIDLDWAMEVYQALRSRSRDASGHFKRVQTKLASEIQMSLDDSEVDNMQSRLNKLQEDFREALKLTKEGVPTLDDIDRLLDPKMKQLFAVEAELDKFIIGLFGGMETFGVASKEALPKLIAYTEANLENLDRQLTKAYEDRHVVSGELDKLKELGKEGLEEYEVVLRGLENELQATEEAILSKGFSSGLEVNERTVAGMVGHLNGLEVNTTEVLSGMFDNSPGLISMEKTDAERSEGLRLKTELFVVTEKHKQLEHLLSHAKQTESVECPSCNTVFKPGVNFKLELDGPQLLIDYGKKIEELNQGILEKNMYLSQVQDYVAGLERFNQLQKMYSGYADLWERIGEFGLETNNPKAALGILNEYLDWITLHQHRIEIMSSLTEKRRVYDQAKEIDSKDMESTLKHATELDQLIETLITEVDVLRKRRGGLIDLNKTVEQMDEALRVSMLLVDEINSILEVEEDSQVNQLLDNVLCTLQGEITHLERQVSTIRVQKAIIEDLKSTLEDAKFEQDLYKVLADELSPTNGLIADVLKRFIESFTGNVSSVIGSIWTYPLEVLPCISNTKEGLDYKFPVRAFGSDLLIPDISEGSDAQVDVIDFAFVVVLRKLLGLEHFPLYLDEPISRMDEVHRIEMIRIIQSMVESNQCSQMFFISHFAAQHGSFAEAETLVMDSSNIVNLPTIYNKHCIIK